MPGPKIQIDPKEDSWRGRVALLLEERGLRVKDLQKRLIARFPKADGKKGWNLSHYLTANKEQQREPRISAVAAIATVLDVRLDWLVSNIEPRLRDVPPDPSIQLLFAKLQAPSPLRDAVVNAAGRKNWKTSTFLRVLESEAALTAEGTTEPVGGWEKFLDETEAGILHQSSAQGSAELEEDIERSEMDRLRSQRESSQPPSRPRRRKSGRPS